jgi:exo-1,4-beta-D-glucosaminidase
LHIQYSYADSNIWVVNGFYKDFGGLKASLRLYNFNMEEKLAKEAAVSIASDESKKVITFDKPADISPVYFLKLELKDASGKLLSSNFYWLSVKGDEKADFTDLNKLPKVDLNYTVSPLQKTDGKYTLTFDVENSSSALAFSVNPKILKDVSGDLVTPVFWEDNYFSLLPKEKRRLKVQFDAKDLGGEKPVLKIDGWNINPLTQKVKM